MNANHLSSDADPMAAQVLAFGAAHGVAAVSPDQTWELLERAGVWHPGLEFAAWTDTTALGGLLGPIMLNSPDVRTALDDLCLFHPMFDRDRIDVARTSRGVSLSVLSAEGGPSHPDTVDAVFALLCRTVRRLAGHQAAPAEVRFRRPAPVDPGVYDALFGRVVFAARADVCLFGEAALSVPIVQADPVVRSMLRPYAQRRATHRQVSWAAAVGKLLADGVTELTDAARALAVSTRTLQSRLEGEGTSFAALADSLRRERALGMIAMPDLPVTVIAARLGFATPSAFTRAFRRWTGMSPSRYRQPEAR
ncbi:helix-turn-helix transcriptional regulator [Streptacidiphilus melanogenes]|uniref:helix-turn-helix transcriptional regulator n=1 Tax=Streptacidiphilus melanogenes TaxID=411235 RepID=UPI0005A6D8C9|nr:AraC family transcriptional regulator [Streptacidiphilus melanogenes]